MVTLHSSRVGPAAVCQGWRSFPSLLLTLLSMWDDSVGSLFRCYVSRASIARRGCVGRVPLGLTETPLGCRNPRALALAPQVKTWENDPQIFSVKSVVSLLSDCTQVETLVTWPRWSHWKVSKLLMFNKSIRRNDCATYCFHEDTTRV